MGNITAASEWVSEADLERREEEWVDAVLLGALERIEFGWEQGSFYGDGLGHAVSDEDALTFCLLGAVDASARALRFDFLVRSRAKRRLALALGKERRDDYAVWTFNDAKKRSKHEVLELLKSVISQGERHEARSLT